MDTYVHTFGICMTPSTLAMYTPFIPFTHVYGYMSAHICCFHDILYFAQQPLIQASLNSSQAHKAENSTQENVLILKYKVNTRLPQTDSVSIKIHSADRHLFYDMESKSK